MRLTLEELKAMSNEDLYQLWRDSGFPFDSVKSCHRCLTGHHLEFEDCSEHRALAHEVTALHGEFDPYQLVVNHLEELYALRLFYDSLYAPAEATPTPTDAVAEEAAAFELVEKKNF